MCDRRRVTNESNVPTLTEIWDFLVGLKETTESGFNRLTLDLHRIEQRLVRIEAWNIDARLDDHEQRIARLEQQL